jgi:hypothetical protein
MGGETRKPPPVWAGLKDSASRDFTPGYGFSCIGSGPDDKLSAAQRMKKDAATDGANCSGTRNSRMNLGDLPGRPFSTYNLHTRPYPPPYIFKVVRLNRPLLPANM